ncbi:hypothetical protein [Candidatus Absconditicoccus praedator]|uniref:hypothetical protein n=1 Tax=Candidatus Absconditicoccus praedator TaxID=2735562 RepID=UPI001E2D98BE|nr:hypothetical protein [Candidatus Absconditicoccus praedator]UFX83425.1 hypothetical protein HLG78_04830 [Candidatus Absconditicoccus praedator]
MQENENIKINYKFDGITDALQEDLKTLIEKNINGKLDRYLNAALQKDDAEARFEIDVRKNKQEKYEGSFRLNLDGKGMIYQNDVPFKNITDLVNHAFDHFKREMSDK